MPTLASALAASKPRIKLVYSREDFTKIPLRENVAEYPELRYVGSKHRFLPGIHGVCRGLNFEPAADELKAEYKL